MLEHISKFITGPIERARLARQRRKDDIMHTMEALCDRIDHHEAEAEAAWKRGDTDAYITAVSKSTEACLALAELKDKALWL